MIIDSKDFSKLIGEQYAGRFFNDILNNSNLSYSLDCCTFYSSYECEIYKMNLNKKHSRNNVIILTEIESNSIIQLYVRRVLNSTLDEVIYYYKKFSKLKAFV